MPSACSRLWNKEWFAIRIRDLGSGTYVVFLYTGDLLFSSELWQCPPLIQEVGGQCSVSFLPCLRQFKFTLRVLGNWFIQGTSWHGDTLCLTCWRGVMIWPGKEGRLIKPRADKARGSKTVLPNDEAISWDGPVVGSATSQKYLNTFVIGSSLIRGTFHGISEACLCIHCTLLLGTAASSLLWAASGLRPVGWQK